MMKSSRSKQLQRIIILFTLLLCSMLILLLFIFSPANAGEYDGFKIKHFADSGQLREAEEWLIRGNALVRRIEKLIEDWHDERNRDLEQESVCQALKDVDDFIRRNGELFSIALSNCRNARLSEKDCPSVARYREGKEQLINHQKKLQVILMRGNQNDCR